MTAVSVAADNARYDAMDATTNTGTIGGGAGEGVETDIVYQGTASISRKVTAAGLFTSTGTARDMTTTGRRTYIFKAWLTNYGSLTTTGNILELRLGSGAGDYYQYIIGSPTVDYPARGGWVIGAIDLNIASHRDGTTGSPALTAVDYFGIYSQCSTSKAENLCLDAIDVGVGLYITGGTSPDPAGNFADFVADDEGDLTNGRFGYVFTSQGVPNVFGRLIIGATSSSGTRTTTATRFTDTGGTVVFPENKAQAGFSGLSLDAGNASTAITINRYAFVSNGTSAGEDTRAVLECFGTSGTIDLDSSSFTNFASLDLTSAVSLQDGTVATSGQIDVATAGTTAANLSGTTISSSTATAAVLWNVNDDTDGQMDGASFISAGTGHAIEFGANTPASVTIREVSVSGYSATTGNETIYNNSGGALTINLVGTTGTFSIRNGTGASTTVVINPVTLTITARDADTGGAIQSARALIFADTGGALNAGLSISSITRSGSTATVTTGSAHNLSTNDIVLIRDTNVANALTAEAPYAGTHSVTVTGASTFTFTVSGTPTTPATGSYELFDVIINNALTNVSGVVSDTRSYASNQPIRGSISKGGGSTPYGTTSISGTIDSVSGLSLTVSMSPDG